MLHPTALRQNASGMSTEPETSNPGYRSAQRNHTLALFESARLLVDVENRRLYATVPPDATFVFVVVRIHTDGSVGERC